MAKKKVEKDGVPETLENELVIPEVENAIKEEDKSVEGPYDIVSVLKSADTDKMSLEEIQKFYSENYEKYKEFVSTIMNEEELSNEEKKIVDLYQEHDNVIKDRRYPLAESVVFDGGTAPTKYSRKDISRLVCKFINKLEVDYKTTLGMFQLYKFWLNPSDSVTYGVYDSTLRVLGMAKYNGFNEWKDVLAIIEFFKKNNEMYAKDACRYDFLADCHTEIMNRMELTAGHTEEADALEGVVR